MTPLYKVATKHTKQVLKDFIKFTYKVKNPQTSMRLLTLSGCFFVLAAAFKNLTTEMSICIAIGTIILLFTLFRHQIALFKLVKTDENYKQQAEIVFSFGMGDFIIENKVVSSVEKLKYSHITALYKDTRNYLIGVNNKELHILPYSDFKLGSVKEFNAFIKERTEKEVAELNPSLKQRLKDTIDAMKLAEKQHDQKIAEKKKKS